MSGRSPVQDDGLNLQLPASIRRIAAGVVICLVTFSVTAGDITDGLPDASEAVSAAALFNTYCLLCHGPDGSGVPGLGVSLVDSSFVQSQPEADLAEFLKIGRLPNDPASISGRPMPGFAWMQAAELSAIAVHIKALDGSQARN